MQEALPGLPLVLALVLLGRPFQRGGNDLIHMAFMASVYRAALSASSGNDTIRLGPTQVILTSSTVYGLDGNDLIDLAQIGRSATFTLTATGLPKDSGAHAAVGLAIGSSTYTFGTGAAGAASGAYIAIASTGIVDFSKSNSENR